MNVKTKIAKTNAAQGTVTAVPKKAAKFKFLKTNKS